MFAPELARGVVRAVLEDWTLPPIDLWAVFPAGRRVSAKARAFVAFIEEVLAEDQDNAAVSRLDDTTGTPDV